MIILFYLLKEFLRNFYIFVSYLLFFLSVWSPGWLGIYSTDKNSLKLIEILLSLPPTGIKSVSHHAWFC